MRLVRWSFALAALYGLAATLPLYLAPPSAADPWRDLFAGAAAATQLLYLLIATDPLRYRTAMPVGVLSKLSFAVPIVLAHLGGRPAPPLLFAVVDLALAGWFAACFVGLDRVRRRASPAPRPLPPSTPR